MDINKESRRVLMGNWREGYTVPSPKLYPFQWNWDSGFIALGYLHIDPEMALLEMEYLFRGQWEDGFLPHIVFHNAEKYGSGYFPSADYWNSQVSDKAPKSLKTSGISQPPIHGYIVERLYQQLGKSDRVVKLFDQVLAYHRCLYEVRDVHNNGLVSVWHNWETGMDNSPWWDEALGRIDSSQLSDIFMKRKDVEIVEDSKETRPSDDEYKRYLWLLLTLQKRKYASCPDDFPFQILELTFNSLLLVSTHSILRLGQEFDIDVSWFETRLQRGINSFNELLWNEEDGIYYPYDILAGKQIKMAGAASFLPLFGQVPSHDQAKRLVERLDAYDGLYGIPSFDPNQSQFEQKKYWRGPIWVNMNYMIWLGLKNYGYKQEADSLKKRTFKMVERYGIREYYPLDPKAETAYGATDFSWTASLILDMINT